MGPTPQTRGSIVIVGAGPGVGASVARRFARVGDAVGLIARHGARLSEMAADLESATGADVATATADASDPDQMRRALHSVAAAVGDPDVLCFSPIPDVGLIRPVLETAPEEFMASLRLNIAGAAAAVDTVLPGMRSRGHGSLLFTTGGAALEPDPDRAASAVTTTAASTYVSLLRRALRDTGVRVGHTVIVGPIGMDDGRGHDPNEVAEDLWAQHAGAVRDFPSVLRLP